VTRVPDPHMDPQKAVAVVTTAQRVQEAVPSRGAGAVLACAGLRKSFGDRLAVSAVGFAVAEGETYGLLGPNGAGKTTTISMIAGLLEPDAGNVVVAGVPVSTTGIAAKAAIGYVPQDLAVYPDLTAAENLRFFARLYGIGPAERKSRVAEVLEMIGLTDRATDRVKDFSGGMKRRLNIGIGLLHHPRLLILDEPTVGVDPQSRNAILDNVARLAGEGMAVLYTTHYMEEAERLCDRVGIVDLGELKAEGTRRELVGLIGEHDRVSLQAEGDLGLAAQLLGKLPAVASASARSAGIDLVVDEARNALPELLQTATNAGLAVSTVEVAEPDLEAVFLHLTGKALRE
jgi:ABC-2 type transport system ATP-binding protein